MAGTDIFSPRCRKITIRYLKLRFADSRSTIDCPNGTFSTLIPFFPQFGKPNSAFETRLRFQSKFLRLTLILIEHIRLVTTFKCPSVETRKTYANFERSKKKSLGLKYRLVSERARYKTDCSMNIKQAKAALNYLLYMRTSGFQSLCGGILRSLTPP